MAQYPLRFAVIDLSRSSISDRNVAPADIEINWAGLVANAGGVFLSGPPIIRDRHSYVWFMRNTGQSPIAKLCPICGKPVEQRFRPFCSRRCADVDLHRWLSGTYTVPVIEIDDVSEGEVNERAEGSSGR